MCKGPEVEQTQRLAQIWLKELQIILLEDGFEFVSNKLLHLKMGGFLDMCFFSNCRSHHEEGLVLSIPGQGTHFQIQHSPIRVSYPGKYEAPRKANLVVKKGNVKLDDNNRLLPRSSTHQSSQAAWTEFLYSSLVLATSDEGLATNIPMSDIHGNMVALLKSFTF